MQIMLQTSKEADATAGIQLQDATVCAKAAGPQHK